MMPEVTRLLLNGAPAVAVGAPDLARCDLSLQRGDRVLVEGQDNDASAFAADVIEVQHDQIGIASSGLCLADFRATHTNTCSQQGWTDRP
jgi:hypothetical protein